MSPFYTILAQSQEHFPALPIDPNHPWLLSCWDPHPIAEIPVQSKIDPLQLPRLCSDHPLKFWHYATIPLNSNRPPRPLMLYLHPLRPSNDLRDPQPHFCLHYSVLVLLHSVLVFISLSQCSSFHFWYITLFQYSCSLVLASALPSYISASLLLNSCDPL